MGAAAAEADRTLFVGNLDPKVTEELIFELFHQAGPVIKVKIPKDKDGRPKQFAFVNFKHEESVPYGLSLLNGIKLFGRPIRIQFRSGSSHTSQDSSSSCSPHRASPAGTPHPASTCSRYGSHQPWLSCQAQFGLCALTMRLQPPFGGTYEQPGFALQGYQHPPPPPPPHAFHPSPPLPVPQRLEPPSLRKPRLSAHPYQHLGRERFGERGPDYGRPKRDELGFEERGHHDTEHHYRGGREEDRPRDGWSHDYDYRRESYREGKWHPPRH
ncbi:RBM7 protein, partial [Brachypteracias leptosomus]|nr:RBM7 protein [Brachypteracias leptosomus]